MRRSSRPHSQPTKPSSATTRPKRPRRGYTTLKRHTNSSTSLLGRQNSLKTQFSTKYSIPLNSVSLFHPFTRNLTTQSNRKYTTTDRFGNVQFDESSEEDTHSQRTQNQTRVQPTHIDPDEVSFGIDELNDIAFGSKQLRAAESGQQIAQPQRTDADKVHFDTFQAGVDFNTQAFFAIQTKQLELITNISRRQHEQEAQLALLTEKMTEMSQMLAKNQEITNAFFTHYKRPEYLTNHNLQPHERLNEVLTHLYSDVKTVSTELGHLIKTLYPIRPGIIRHSYGTYRKNQAQAAAMPQPQSDYKYPPPAAPLPAMKPLPGALGPENFPFPPPVPSPPRNYPPPTQAPPVRFDVEGNKIDEKKWENWKYPPPVNPESLLPRKTAQMSEGSGEGGESEGQGQGEGGSRNEQGVGTSGLVENGQNGRNGSKSGQSDQNDQKGQIAKTLPQDQDETSPVVKKPVPVPPLAPPATSPTRSIGRPSAAAVDAKLKEEKIASEEAKKRKIVPISGLSQEMVPDVISDIPEIDLDIKW